MTIDGNSNTTSYAYNATKGLLNSTTDPNGNLTQYTYNANNDQLQSVTAGGSTVSYAYNKDRLTGINVSNGVQYTLQYDAFGRTSATKVGNTTLSSVEYNANGLMSRQNYGNGDYITFSYDSLDRLAEKIYNGDSTKKQSYYYGANGLLSLLTDTVTDTATRYVYDLSGRLAEQRVYSGASPRSWDLKESVAYTYADQTNYITQVTCTSALGTQTVSYTYGSTANGTMPDTVYTVKQGSVNHLQYSFDDLGRLSARAISPIGKTQSYTYLAGGHGANSTTTLVDSVTVDGVTTSYSYDANGNITEIRKNGTVYESYEYDGLNQLTKVTCAGGDVYTYTYQNGNLLTVSKNGTAVKTYCYTDQNWKDKLTAFNGNTITYDTIGNPLTYHDGKSFTWQNGRRLTTVTDGADSYSYTYDAAGIRTGKTVNGTTTSYTVIDGRLIGETTGSNTLVYLYDEAGNRYGFTCNGINYYYDLNLQGDVIGIYDSTGAKVVEYTCNAWGELLSVTGSQATTIGNINPIRYRGYYYDTETGFYYLQSRYYDPVTQRFLNADGYVSTGNGILGYNMFAYCGNNPVNMTDENGNWPKWIENAYKQVKKAVNKVVNTVKKFVNNTITHKKEIAKAAVSSVEVEVSSGFGFSGAVEVDNIGIDAGIKTAIPKTKITAEGTQPSSVGEAYFSMDLIFFELGPMYVEDLNSGKSQFSFYRIKDSITLVNLELYFLYGLQGSVSFNVDSFLDKVRVFYE